MHRQLHTKDSPITSPAYHRSTANKLSYIPPNTNKDAHYPTKQDPISCADFGQPVFTNYLHSSPVHRNDSTQLSTISTDPQPSTESTQLHTFCHPQASMKGRKRPKTDMYSHSNSLDISMFDQVGTLSGCGGWGSRSARTGKGLA